MQGDIPYIQDVPEGWKAVWITDRWSKHICPKHKLHTHGKSEEQDMTLTF